MILVLVQSPGPTAPRTGRPVEAVCSTYNKVHRTYYVLPSRKSVVSSCLRSYELHLRTTHLTFLSLRAFSILHTVASMQQCSMVQVSRSTRWTGTGVGPGRTRTRDQSRSQTLLLMQLASYEGGPWYNVKINNLFETNDRTPVSNN